MYFCYCSCLWEDFTSLNLTWTDVYTFILQMYPLLERISPGTRKLELFARMHNTHAGYANLTYYIANKNNWWWIMYTCFKKLGNNFLALSLGTFWPICIPYKLKKCCCCLPYSPTILIRSLECPETIVPMGKLSLLVPWYMSTFMCYIAELGYFGKWIFILN